LFARQLVKSLPPVSAKQLWKDEITHSSEAGLRGMGTTDFRRFSRSSFLTFFH
jgi:hypothetical protein